MEELSNLFDHLVQRKPPLTPDELSALKESPIFMTESLSRHRADELYPPVEIFRELHLPVIAWGGRSEWRDTSSEGAWSAICIRPI